MSLAATVQCDFRVQWRNGFYYASVLVVVGTIVVLRFLPKDMIAYLLPAFIFQNVVVNSFYFAAGQILLENVERTRAVQLVTPLRRSEYLGAKVVTLGALSVIESLVISLSLQGFGPGLLPLTIGVSLGSLLLTLFGIAIVCRYPSINEFIMPSVLYTLLLGLPMIGWFGVAPAIVFDWHPLQGPLHLIGARHAPVGTGRFVFLVVAALAWVVPIYFWGRRALRRNVQT